MSEIVHLVDRSPTVAAADILAGFVPSARFAKVSFDSYVPDPAQPSQKQAAHSLRDFAASVGASTSGSTWGKLFGKKSEPTSSQGIYLDGGFGVGKTHLLASLFHAAKGKRAFGTFVEYTNAVGALTFAGAVNALKDYDLVCIDEFELDDPGDTVLMSRLMRELADAGVKLAATSNTLPGALGEGRFAAQDFKREIQVLAKQFEVQRIDGEDFRHRGLPEAPESLSNEQLAEVSAELFADKVVAEDDFTALLEHLSKVHPSKYRDMINGVQAVVWRNVHTIEDQATALRFVVLVDRLYDVDVPILASGVNFDQVFTAEMMAGGYMKKYYRAVSRLTALTRQARFHEKS